MASDTDDKLSSSESHPAEQTPSAADSTKPSLRVTLRSSVLTGASSKTTVGPRTPPGPEPTSVSCTGVPERQNWHSLQTFVNGLTVHYIRICVKTVL